MRFTASIGLACGLLFGACLSAQDLRIDNVTVISPERDKPLLKASVVIRNDRIIAVGKAPRTSTGQVIDGTGLYLAPGLIDSHVHLGDVPGMLWDQQQANPRLASEAMAQMPRSYLYYGFTTLLDLISTSALAKRWNERPLHPDLYFCGGAPVLDGYPMSWAPKPQRYASWSYLIIQPEDAASAPEGMDPAAHTPAAVVKRMRADGAICVKSFFERGFGEKKDLPVPTHDTMRALIQAAREQHMPVFLHANGSEAQAFAVETGVDVIVHGMWHWTGDDPNTSTITPGIRKVLDAIVTKQIGWQATLQVLHGELDLFDPAWLNQPELAHVASAELIQWYGSADGQRFRNDIAASVASAPEVDMQTARVVFDPYLARNRNVTAYLAERKARFLFGSDTPSAPTYANPPGLNGFMEMRKLADAGLTPTQIFRAATLENAKAIGLDRDIGSVEPGKRANLLLLRKDPTQSVDAFNEIVKVIIGGKVVDREELAADRKR